MTTLEDQLAARAQREPSSVELGDHYRCEMRLLDRSENEAYFEALCSATTHVGSDVDLGCVPPETESFDEVGIARLSHDRPVDLRFDDLNDHGQIEWMERHLPSELQDFESGGPQFGELLYRRLTTEYGC